MDCWQWEQVSTEATEGLSANTTSMLFSLGGGKVDSLQNLNAAKYELLANAKT